MLHPALCCVKTLTSFSNQMPGMKLLVLLILFGIAIPKSTINTIAGCHSQTSFGFTGIATSTVLSEPNQITVDRAGNIYISESGNNIVSRINTDGTITVVAGNRTKGYSGDGGPATSASLFAPTDVAFDRYGNMFVADGWNNCIRKINSQGIITTIAGTGIPGFSGDGGLATKALLRCPMALAFDSKGNLYVADCSNYRIRKITPLGFISTVGGTGIRGIYGDNGPATKAMIGRTTDIAVDSKDNIYIVDDGNNRIRKISKTGVITTIAGTGDEGYSEDGTLAKDCLTKYPYGIFIDKDDNIFFSDNGNVVIRKVDKRNIVTTVAGSVLQPGYSGDGNAPLRGKIFNPGGIAIDHSGNLLIADYGNNTVRIVTNVYE